MGSGSWAVGPCAHEHGKAHVCRYIMIYRYIKITGTRGPGLQAMGLWAHEHGKAHECMYIYKYIYIYIDIHI